MITGRVVGGGGAQAHRAAADLRRIHDRELSLATRNAVRDAVEDKLPQLLRVSAVAHLPSGYGGPVLAPSLRVRTLTVLSTGRGSKVGVVIWAKGIKEHRDVYARDIGWLRHPVFGNRRNWVTQRIRPRFADRALTALRPVLIRDIDQAVSRVADRYNAGV